MIIHKPSFVVDDATGATFWPTNAGACFNATNARFRVAGVDLSVYASADNRYKLVPKDTAGKVAKGYIDLADDAEALGSDLLSDEGDMEDTTDFDDSLGIPTTNERSNTEVHDGSYSRKITAAADYDGCRSDKIITTTTGKGYKLELWVYPDDTTDFRIYIRDGADSVYIVNGIAITGLTQDTWNKVDYYYTETNGGSSGFVGFTGTAAGTWYFDSVTYKEVTHVGTDGVLIMSTKGGSTQSWALQESGIDLNGIATFEVQRATRHHSL